MANLNLQVGSSLNTTPQPVTDENNNSSVLSLATDKAVIKTALSSGNKRSLLSVDQMALSQLEGGAFFGRVGIKENQWDISGRGTTWVARDTTRNWHGIAVSSDGKIQVATVNNGHIYVSNDYGQTWTDKNQSGGMFAAMSSDGKFQTVVAWGNYIYVSSDYGDTWAAMTNTSINWAGIALSSDGKFQLAVAYGGHIWISSDYGQNWTDKDTNRNWSGAAMSSDGAIQVTAVYGGQIYTSTDYGNTWAASGTNKNWRSVAMSSDGKFQTRCVAQGHLYTSNDYGASWTEVVVGGSSKDWYGVAMTSDGKYQTATVMNGKLYVSSDYGASWTEKMSDADRGWRNIAMSSNGQYQTATCYGGYLYTSFANSCVSGSVGLGTPSPLANLHNNGDFITKGPWFDVRAFGASGSAQTTTGTIILNQYTLTLASAIDFQNGQGIQVKGAGAWGANLITTIVSGAGTTTLTLADAAAVTKTGTDVLHDDTAAIQAAINYVHQYNGGIVFLPSGTYKISSSDGISCLYIGKYPTVDGRGVQLIGTGALSTILEINNSSIGVTAITIQAGGSPLYPSVNVVIKDLQITIAGGQDDLHTGINNILGLAAFFENVTIQGADAGSNRIKYGIIASAWGCNLYHFCQMNSFSRVGMWLKADDTETHTDPNATKIIDCTFNGPVFSSLDHDVFGVKVEAGTASEITGCTFNSNPSPNTAYKAIDIYLGSSSQQTVVMNNYHENADIGIRIESCGNTVSGNWYSVGDEYVQITSGYEEGNIVIGSRNNATVSTDPVIFHSEIADIANVSALGSESLNNGSFGSGGSWWSCNGKFSFPGDYAYFYDNIGNGQWSQLCQGSMAIAGVGNRWYKLVYKVTNSNYNPAAGNLSACVSDAFAVKDTYLNLKNGTHVLYFKTKSSPGSFTIGGWSNTAGNTFTLDDLSLKEIQVGDMAVHGLITGGGTSGIKVLGDGAVGINTTSPTAGTKLDVNGNIKASGSVQLGAKETSNPAAGMLAWDSGHVKVYDGSTWQTIW